MVVYANFLFFHCSNSISIMRSIMKVALTFLLIVQLLATAKAIASKNCTEKCGNTVIPYPFGVEDGCFLPGFNITCNETSSKAYIWNVEVTDILLTQAQMRIYNRISFACYYKNGDLNPVNSVNFHLNFTNTPYSFSSTRNKFTAVGCQTLAYIQDPVSKTSPYMSGCLSICNNQNSVQDNTTCSGMGCCQTPIPEGLEYYRVMFDSGFNHSAVWDFNPCSYAFLVEDEWYRFNKSDVYKFDIYYRNNRQVPVVLDWAIGTETCEEAKLNKTGNYSCASSNSICIDSKNGPGYNCNCSKGYEGNPYVTDGCKDINECLYPTLYGCYGKCDNIPGNFTCSCPHGKHGNPKEGGGCVPKFPLFAKILIAGLCAILVAAVMYVTYEKAKLIRTKEKCFRQNGGLLLQEQINAHQSVRFKIFSIKELKRATNNFDENKIKGRGGQGIVYEGVIDDKRMVAVKKSTMIDEEKKKEFAKEMYILSLLNHKNIIQIFGCCLEVEVPMLVYEFISKGTLSQRIQEKNQRMSLGFRLNIAINCASALAYLHTDCHPSIVHGDIKSTNILLDEDNVAKVSDFGASTLPRTDRDEKGVPGTYGYLDPEALTTLILTEKSDVYSFAVVILELLTRMTAVYLEKSGRKKNLAETFKREGLEKILDEEIRHVMTNEQKAEFTDLLSVCLRNRGAERPTMTKVVAWLRKMEELGQNLSSDESVNQILVPMQSESSHQNTYTAEYYSTSGNQAEFELECRLIR